MHIHIHIYLCILTCRDYTYTCNTHTYIPSHASFHWLLCQSWYVPTYHSAADGGCLPAYIWARQDMPHET